MDVFNNWLLIPATAVIVAPACAYATQYLTLEQAQQATHGQVAEGVKSCRSVLELARRHGAEVPITEAVDAVCYGGMSPVDMIGLLMGRAMKSETG